MMLKGTLILCTVSIICVCEELSTHADGTTTEVQSDKKEFKEIDRIFNIEKEYYNITRDKLNWTDAKDACKNKGMTLAILPTYLEGYYLQRYVYIHNFEPKDVYSGYWIGSYRQSTQDPWVWYTNGEKVGKSSFWLSGEPNGLENENCMEFKNDMMDMGWNNLACDNLRGYICESRSIYSHELSKNLDKYFKVEVHGKIEEKNNDRKKM